MKKIINEIKESIVFLGYLKNGHEQITGTGFLMQIDGVFHLVTAKHVIEKDVKNLCVFINSRHLKNPICKPLSKIYSHGYTWIRHPDPNVDVAMIPFFREDDDKVRFVPENLIDKDMGCLHELLDVFYLSFQPNLNNLKEEGVVDPIIRKGTISRVNNNSTLYIDGSAFPGNSGSPVFLFPTPVRINNDQVEIGGPMKILLVGVMGAYIPYQDIAISQQTNRPRVIFEENTGISLVWSTKFIDQIVHSNDFQNQIKIIKDKAPKISVPIKEQKNNSQKPII